MGAERSIGFQVNDGSMTSAEYARLEAERLIQLCQKAGSMEPFYDWLDRQKETPSQRLRRWVAQGLYKIKRLTVGNT